MERPDPLTGARWRTSTHSTKSPDTCVEVAPAPGVVGVRDTEHRTAGHLTVPRPAWTAFLTHLTHGA